jgi:hypothetical protein
MALRGRVARRWSCIVNVLQGIFISAGALAAGAINFQPVLVAGKVPAEWIEAILWIKGSAGIVVPVAAFLTAFAASLKKIIGPKHIWDAVHTLLDDFREKAFSDSSFPHSNRVTLFKHQQLCFKLVAWKKMFSAEKKPIWGGWLVPVDRSGDVTQNPKIAFSAPKDRPDLAEGFAGKIWTTNTELFVEGLPLLERRLIGDPDGENKILRYCKSSYGSVDDIKKRLLSNQWCPRSFWGIHLESENGKVWGVLLIDSHEANLRNRSEIAEQFRTLANTFKALLKHI